MSRDAGTSLASRLTLLLAATASAGLLAFAASALGLTARTLQREERALLENTASRLAWDLDQELREEHELSRAAAAVLSEEDVSGFRIDIVDPAGRLVASSIAQAPGTEGGRGAPVSPRHGFSQGIQSATARSASGSTVTVSVSSHLRRLAIAALGRGLLLTWLPLFLVTFVVGRSLIRKALRPLAEMEERALRAAAGAGGRSGVRSIGPPAGMAEVDALRDSFNRLLARLDDLLESERRFASDASHELKTPLTVLSGELELALGEPDLPSAMRAGLLRARDQARAMGEIIEALLLLRRVAAGLQEPAGLYEAVNLADIVRETAIEAAARHPERKSDLSVKAPDEILAWGHPVLLVSAVRNLVDNALKFSAPGQPVRIRAVSDEADARVVIEDGGPGIPPADRERVFDPFFRGTEARATRPGTGLGLPILREVARAHGGEVSLEESSLGGARFVLRLALWSPREQSTGPTPAGVSSVPATPRSSGGTPG